MIFWDTSALIPLFLRESNSTVVKKIFAHDSAVVVWWAAHIECASAICREERTKGITPLEATKAFAVLSQLSPQWHQIIPSERIKQLSIRLLRTHALTSADAQQLAGLLVAQQELGASLPFVCFDQNLIKAAIREGVQLHGKLA